AQTGRRWSGSRINLPGLAVEPRRAAAHACTQFKLALSERFSIITRMEIPVRAAQRAMSVRIELAHDFLTSHLDDWAAGVADGIPAQQDAAEYLESALSKSAFEDRKNRVARSVDEFRTCIAQRPKTELLGVITASAPSADADTRMLGFCQFGRTS